MVDSLTLTIIAHYTGRKLRKDVIKWLKLSLKETNLIVTLVPSDTLTMVKNNFNRSNHKRLFMRD